MMRATNAGLIHGCVLGCILGVLLTLGGCAKPVTTAPLMDALSAHDLGFTPQWAANLEVPAAAHLSHVVVLDDAVVTVESPSNIVTALSLRNGKEVWSRQIAGTTETLNKPFQVGDRIYLCSQSLVHVVDATNGQELAQHNLESSVKHAPAVINGRAIFGAMTGLVFAEDLTTGAVAWRARMPGRIVAAPAAAGTMVVVADQNGEYALMHGVTGRVLWMGRTFGPITANPEVGGDLLLIASEDQSLYAVNALSGNERWKYAAGQRLTLTPSIVDGVVLLPLPRGGTVALDAAQGNVLWQSSLTMEPISGGNGQMLVSAGRAIASIDSRTGGNIVSATVQPLQTALATPNGMVLISARGRVLKLDRQ